MRMLIMINLNVLYIYSLLLIKIFKNLFIFYNKRESFFFYFNYVYFDVLIRTLKRFDAEKGAL